jgi:glucose-6-phosphate dehydrogenase assembly protein OpcA
MSGARSDRVWSATDTTPTEVEAAIRQLVVEMHGENRFNVPARALNMVCVVDKEWSGEIANRLRRVGRYHASRTVVCSVEPRRTTIDAMASVATSGDPSHGELVLLRETIVLTVGEKHLPVLASIVDPLVVSDLATVVWSPHGHPEAVDSLLSLAQSVLFDSVDDPEPEAALERAAALASRAYVVDLGWLRTTPWRERVAAYFDPAPARPQLLAMSAVTVRHGPGSEAAGLLFLGWLSSRLGWEPGTLMRVNGSVSGKAHARRQDVKLTLCEVAQDTPGLKAVTVETADGTSLTLARGPGGLLATRVGRDGRSREWTVLGASRGEGGILGEGIRQALLRDPTYAPALRCARSMAA